MSNLNYIWWGQDYPMLTCFLIFNFNFKNCYTLLYSTTMGYSRNAGTAAGEADEVDRY